MNGIKMTTKIKIDRYNTNYTLTMYNNNSILSIITINNIIIKNNVIYCYNKNRYIGMFCTYNFDVFEK